MPAKILPGGERERRPLSPATAISRAVARCAAPAPPRQIPAAPLSPAVRHEAGPMAEGHRPEDDFEKGDDDMEQDNRESWLNRVAVGMA